MASYSCSISRLPAVHLCVVMHSKHEKGVFEKDIEKK